MEPDPIEKMYLADPLLVEAAHQNTTDMLDRTYGKEAARDKNRAHGLGVYLGVEVARAQRYKISSPEQRVDLVSSFLTRACGTN